MKKPVQFLTSFVLLFVLPQLTIASNPTSPKWIVNHPFEQKVFIENKGQFNLSDKLLSKDILFGAQQDGLNYYFTSNGIWIERYITVKRTPEEIEKLQLPASEKSLKAFEYKFIEVSHQIEFIGANPLTEVTGSNQVPQHYNYKASGINIKANAYNKILYKNLYPGIDMEFYFPIDKQGFKYSFIVHPGADVSQLKMQYPLNEGLQLTPDGNISITSAFGNFTDHAPIANQGSLKNINCVFTLSNGTVQFKTGDYNKSQDLIIDPWTATPVFPKSISDRSYDVDWDNAGNCYIYGGSGQYAQFPLYLVKYNSNGTLVWQTQIDDYYQQDYGTELYGDFVVDKKSQSIYVAQGVNIVNGAKIIKLDQSGTQVDSSTGNPNMVAIFRIILNTKYNELVGVGGSYPNYPAPTSTYIDTNLTNQTIVYTNNPPNPYHYMWGLTQDNFGNCYGAISGRSFVDTSGNDMFKMPLPSLSPTSWEVNDGYEISGIIQPQYLAHNNGNGFNGMTVIDTDLFTYDSYTLRKWGTTHGTLLQTLNINGDSTKLIYWGGITSDSCGDVFLGSHDTVKQYNTNLALMNYFLAPDSIYDLNLGNNNILYGCGATFVAAFQLTPHQVNTNNNTDADTTLYYKICMGNYVSLKAGGAVSYKWSPSYGLNATTGDSVVASPSVTTTYTVICSGSLSCPASLTDTFKVVVTVDTLPLPKITVTPTSSTICFGKSVSLHASGTKSYQWSPIQGLNSTTGDSVIASPAISTTYTVKGIGSNGCFDIGHSIITVDTLPQLSVYPDYSFICTGQSVTLYGFGQHTYQWSPSTGLSATTGDSVIASPISSTLYTVTVNGSDGCSNSANIQVYVDPKPVVLVFPKSPSVCPGDSILLNAGGARRYNWSPTTGLDSISKDTMIASPASTTTYTIIGTNRYGCSDTVQTVVTVGLPKVIITPSSPHVCYGHNISLSAGGANTFQWSPSIGLNATTGSTVIANPTITTTYTIIGNNGCADTTTTVVTVDSLPKVTIPDSSLTECSGEGILIIAAGANSYQWSPSAGLNASTGDTVIATVTIATTYTVTGTNSNGCTGTAAASISIIQGPNKPSITKSVTGDSLISSATQGNQWYRNDTLISGATNQVLIITSQSKGSYTVNVINPANGCSATSDTVILTDINSLSINAHELFIYPNPFSNEIIVQINSAASDVKNWTMQITDVLGRQIYSTISLNYHNVFDLSNMPSGIYFITIDTQIARKVFPIVRQE